MTKRIKEIDDELKEIESRASEINTAVETADEATMKSLNDELTEKEARKKSLMAEKAELEQKEKDARNLESGKEKGTPIEMPKVEKKNMEIKNGTPEYRDAWIKNLQGKELSVEEREAMTASSAIPTQTMDEIIGKLELNPMIAAVGVTHIPGNVVYPTEGTINDAAWVAMGTAATDAADTLSSITLGAYKLIKTISITADVAAMSINAFESWLVARLANKLEKAVDAGILTGTGSNQATGILTTVSSSVTYTKTAMKYKDLCKIIAGLPTQYLQNATFVMPRALFFGEVLGMVDTSENRVCVLDPQSPAKYNILGYPVIVDDNCTADNVIFGDLTEYKFNFAKDPEVMSDTSAEFRTGNTVYRALALADGKVGNSAAFVVATRATA